MDKSMLENLQRAVSLNPQFAEGHFAIASFFHLQNNLGAAIASYQKAINAKPDFEQAYFRIGQILRSQGKLVDAIAVYRKALANLPSAAIIYRDLGTALLETKQSAEALSILERAVALDPNCSEAHRGIGMLLLEQNKMNEGVVAFKRSVDSDPKNIRAWMNLADAYNRAGKVADAVACWRKVVALDPNYAQPYHFILSFSQYLSGRSREQILADHVAFGDRFETFWREKWPTPVEPLDPNKRLRVGFVSGDLNNHPVGFFVESVFAELRKLDGIDIVAYPTNPTMHAVSERIRASTHAWTPVFQLSDDAFAKRIRDDKIDILVDLSGHTNLNRLLVFARKPAPIQVTWLGYWETTGLRAIDYILCDRYSLRDEEAKFYVEQPWYLPGTRLCFTLPDESVAVAALPALSNGYITFGCFNNLIKITDNVIAVWSRLLKRIPNARLLLKWTSFADENIREEVKARFCAESISADRLLIEGPSSLSEYYTAYNRVDIALDPFPFPGGTTSVQGIWMGVPMITLKGNQVISRQGESILHNTGLSDWIAKDEEDYVNLAALKAEDVTALAELRSELRGKLESSPLCDAKSFAQNLEDAFKQMWKKRLTESCIDENGTING